MSDEQKEEPKKKWGKGKIALIIFALFIFYLVGSSANDTKKSVDNATENANSPVKEDVVKEEAVSELTQNQTSPVPPIEIITISAKTLISDYKENEVASDSKYKGNRLIVSGIVDGVNNGSFDDSIIVKIGSGEQYAYETVWCNARSSEKDKVVSLKKGSIITVEGIGDSSTIGSPQIKDCLIQ